MKKGFIFAAVVLIMTACAKDPIREKLSSTIKPEAGYKFRNYSITDTITNEEMVETIAGRYHLLEVESKETLSKWREDLAEEMERGIKSNAEIGLEPSYLCKEAEKTIKLLDSLISVYDRVDIYSIDYHLAENRYFSEMGNFLDDQRLQEYAPYLYALQSKSGIDDFAKIAELRKNPSAVYGYYVNHEYSINNPIVENGDRLIMSDNVFFDKDWNVVEVANTQLSK